MACIYRLALILFFLIPSVALATPTIYASADAPTNFIYATVAAACAGHAYNATGNMAGSTCQSANETDGSYIIFSPNFFGTGQSHLSGYSAHSKTGCLAPTVLIGGACVPNPCVAGTVVDSADVPAHSMDGVAGCYSGCNAPAVTMMLPDFCDTYGGVNTCAKAERYAFTEDGTYGCSGNGFGGIPTPFPPKPTPCPACDCMQQGMSFMVVNGVTSCANIGSAGSATVKFAPSSSGSSASNTSTPAPTTSTPNPTPVAGPNDPSVSSSSSTSCAGDGTCTTTTTTTTNNPDGTSTAKQQTTTQTTADYCTSHPQAQMCKAQDKGTFGGACGGFTCDGPDAAACAIAQKIYQERCDDLQTDVTTTLGQSLIDGSGNGTDPFKTPTEFSVGSIDSSVALLPKGCLNDMVFSVMGQSITLPLSHLCEGLQSAGKIVLAFAYMLAARIIFS